MRNASRRSTKLSGRLAARVQQLRNAYQAQKINKRKYDQQAEAIRAEAKRKVEELRAENEQAEAQLNEASERLAQTSKDKAAFEAALDARKGVRSGPRRARGSVPSRFRTQGPRSWPTRLAP